MIKIHIQKTKITLPLHVIKYISILFLVLNISCNEKPRKIEIQWQILKNGERKPRGVLIDGEKNGLWLEYYENGTIGFIKSYKNNILNGPSMFYNLNGKLTHITNYLDSTYHGEYVLYRCDTTCINIKGYYKHGKPVNVWEFYPECDCRLSRKIDYGEDGNKNDTLIDNHLEPVLMNGDKILEAIEKSKKNWD
ncbi:toxin-antitoxin system YwqK family antitoxin [Emticicia soli]|uniref:Toxin-antitoxin system YwqK family antitoxin n=1 Tax=Emticicia soli TaxID=2027878 RepID=A0ABW5JCQ4_9BACT